MKNPSNLESQQNKLAAVHHVVHDYTNLISTGCFTQTPLKPPLNTHVQHAFLVSCRKIAAFFLNLSEGSDILSKHFLAPRKVGFKLSWQKQWNAEMNRQLFHLSYSRIERPKPWDGTSNAVLLKEFQDAWRKFLDNLEEPVQVEV